MVKHNSIIDGIDAAVAVVAAAVVAVGGATNAGAGEDGGDCRNC